MSTIEVLSRTQRIIVEQNSSVRIVSGGVVGPRGLQGPQGVGAAEGVVASPLLVWTINHGLGFKPAGWIFFNDDGLEMEPISISDITDMVATATWVHPISGSWLAS